LESTKNAIEVDKTLKDSIKYSMKYWIYLQIERRQIWIVEKCFGLW
jgi:hypothetical protein